MSGSNNHTLHGFWGIRKPQILGTWTRGLSNVSQISLIRPKTGLCPGPLRPVEASWGPGLLLAYGRYQASPSYKKGLRSSRRASESCTGLAVSELLKSVTELIL